MEFTITTPSVPVASALPRAQSLALAILWLAMGCSSGASRPSSSSNATDALSDVTYDDISPADASDGDAATAPSPNDMYRSQWASKSLEIPLPTRAPSMFLEPGALAPVYVLRDAERAMHALDVESSSWIPLPNPLTATHVPIASDASVSLISAIFVPQIDSSPEGYRVAGWRRSGRLAWVSSWDAQPHVAVVGGVAVIAVDRSAWVIDQHGAKSAAIDLSFDIRSDRILEIRSNHKDGAILMGWHGSLAFLHLARDEPASLQAPLILPMSLGAARVPTDIEYHEGHAIVIAAARCQGEDGDEGDGGSVNVACEVWRVPLSAKDATTPNLIGRVWTTSGWTGCWKSWRMWGSGGGLLSLGVPYWLGAKGIGVSAADALVPFEPSGRAVGVAVGTLDGHPFGDHYHYILPTPNGVLVVGVRNGAARVSKLPASLTSCDGLANEQDKGHCVSWPTACKLASWVMGCDAPSSCPKDGNLWCDAPLSPSTLSWACTARKAIP